MSPDDDLIVPPPVLCGVRRLLYAVIDDSVGYRGHTSLYVDGKELGRVPRLFLGIENNREEPVLLHCDESWDVLGIGGYETVQETKDWAERIYPGLSSHWIEAPVTFAQAERYLDELYGDDRCSVCGRRADKIDAIYETAQGWVCNICRPGDSPEANCT